MSRAFLITCANGLSAATPRPRIPKELAVGEAHQQHPYEDERDLTEASGMPVEAKRAPNDAQAECDDYYRKTNADKTYHHANSSERTRPSGRAHAKPCGFNLPHPPWRQFFAPLSLRPMDDESAEKRTRTSADEGALPKRSRASGGGRRCGAR